MGIMNKYQNLLLASGLIVSLLLIVALLSSPSISGLFPFPSKPPAVSTVSPSPVGVASALPSVPPSVTGEMQQMKENLRVRNIELNRAPADRRQQYLREMEAAADRRIDRLGEIAKTNPADVISNTFSPAEIAQLPPSVQEKSEKRITGEQAELMVLFIDDFEEGRVEKYARKDGRLLRLIEQDENPRPHFSGKNIRINALEIADTLVLMDPISGFGEGAPGDPGQAPAGAENLGAQNIALILFNFNDTNMTFSNAALTTQINAMVNYYRENSYSKT